MAQKVKDVHSWYMYLGGVCLNNAFDVFPVAHTERIVKSVNTDKVRMTHGIIKI